jgi:predicted nucleic acid-binding protein
VYLLDTNVVSELRRPRPDSHVIAWFGQLPVDSCFLSVLTVGEIAKGIAKRRRDSAEHADALQGWLDRLVSEYAERLLPVDAEIAVRWGTLVDAHPQLAVDMLLAATALERDLTMVTRNEDHFRLAGVPVVNPFRRQPRRPGA